MKPAIALSDIIATTIREEPNALLPAPQSDLWDVSAPISVRFGNGTDAGKTPSHNGAEYACDY